MARFARAGYNAAVGDKILVGRMADCILPSKAAFLLDLRLQSGSSMKDLRKDAKEFPTIRASSPVESVNSPWAVWILVLAVVSVTEYAIMLLLPMVLYDEPPRLLESTVDAVALSVTLSPLLWWTVVRPLHRAVQLRERFLGELFASVEQDRRRIAREIHDSLGQSVTLLVSGLRSLAEQENLEVVRRRGRDLERIAETALADVKRLALGLRPTLLDDFGLAAAAECLAAEIQRHYSLTVEVEDETVQGIRFAEKVEAAVFRICQEALNNVVRHASAKCAAVRLVREPHMLVLEVSDDGCGIQKAVLREGAESGHLGLIGMRERAAVLGGELTISSRSGCGTRIIARISAEALDR